ncbi:MAG TPA: glutamine--tRNA ligase/YqeY domain fusion protein [Longimicrobium sp.]|nr:glutamine--tRNA ligase/YqeY domain fusion protein [Longimicrobium sp.]
MNTTASSNLPAPAAEFAERDGLDFIRQIVADDLRAGKYETIVTRFPPEPNGYLHLGHAKSISLNYSIAAETGGRFHLRFDDTNPETEDVHYVESAIDVIKWLGCDFGENLFFAADYFDQMYAYAEWLVQNGKAYVDSSSEEEIREARGTVTEAGRPTRFRDRAAEENLDLLRRMKAGEFPDGAHVLRARIDLAAANMLMRDPILYRIRHAHHYRTGDQWCIYPLYDYAHPIEDAIEGITHSFCTLEFELNRALYDWVVDNWQDFVRSQGGTPSRPRQYEFARGNIEYTITSKRKLLELVKGGYVSGWDDPRMPTIAGIRRLGCTPEALRGFWDAAGVTKAPQRIPVPRLEHAMRDDLNRRSPRVLCVLKPLMVVITNYPEGETEELDAPYWPHDVPNEGSRPLPFSRELFIDRDDFMENPPKGFFRLSPGGEVRLRYAYVIRCDEVIKNDAGEIVELRCSYDPETRGGNTPDGRQVKGTIQWVSASHGVRCEVRLYDRLFTVPDPDAQEGDFKDYLNPQSLVVISDAVIEPSVRNDPAGSHYQFERVGYFCSDRVESTADALVFNRTVTLRDTWGKTAQAAPAQQPRKEKPQAPKPDASPERKPKSKAPAEDTPRSPELEAHRKRFEAELDLPAEELDGVTRELTVAVMFDDAVKAGASARAAANWMIHELPREIGSRTIDNLPFSGRELGELAVLVEDGTLSTAAARQVLGVMANEGGHPRDIVERLGLRQVSDESAIAPAVDEVIAANAAKADEYRGGKTGLLGFFVGQVMRKTGGKANPELVNRLVRERLGGS